MAGLLSLDDVVELVDGVLDGVSDDELPVPVEPAPAEPLSLDVEDDELVDVPPRLSFL